MTAREEILHLMNRYGFTIDTGDLDGFAGLFEHGEWIMEGAAPYVGKSQFLEALSNIIIYDDGTPCYVTVFQQTDEFPLQAIFSGHYFDDFARVGGDWCFRKRLIRYALVGDMSAHLKTPNAVIPEA